MSTDSLNQAPDFSNEPVIYPAPFGESGFNPYDIEGDRWLYETYWQDSRRLGIQLVREKVLANKDIGVARKRTLIRDLRDREYNLLNAYVALEDLLALQKASYSENEIRSAKLDVYRTIDGIEDSTERSMELDVQQL